VAALPELRLVGGGAAVPAEATEEAGLARVGHGVVPVVEPAPPPAEADGAPSEQQQDQAGEGQPEPWAGRCVRVGPGEFIELVLRESVEGNIDSECNEGEQGGEEGDEGGDEGDRDVGGEGEEEGDEGHRCGNGVDGQSAGPVGTDNDGRFVGFIVSDDGVAVVFRRADGIAVGRLGAESPHTKLDLGDSVGRRFTSIDVRSERGLADLEIIKEWQ